MTKDKPQSLRDTRLWLRIVLVGLTGAVPLFVVSLILIDIAYSDAIDFGLQEQRGVAFQRPLEQLFERLPRYQHAVSQALAGAPSAELEVADATRSVDQALGAVSASYDGDLGRALGFTEAELRSKSLDDARLASLQQAWHDVQRAPRSSSAQSEAASRFVRAVRAMISHAGDRSNLILDTDLDSYYLMDITLSTLPQTEQRLSEITSSVADWLKNGQTGAHQTRIAVLAALLRQADLERITRDARTSLSEDARFNGVSPTLHAHLPPAIERLENADQRLLAQLDRIAAGELVPVAELEAAGWEARAESFRLFRTGADELDRLLTIRIEGIRHKRLQGYSLIVATLALAAFAMGLIMRSLLASRYAEILRTQEELRSKETQLRALGDNLPGGMTYQIMRDFDGTMRFLYVSAGIERLNGISAQAALADANQLFQQFLPEDLPALRAAEKESLVRNSVFNVVARMRRSDGAIRWMEFNSAPRFLADGRAVWDGIQMDVTDRQQAEAITKQSEQRFSRIFDNSPIPITLSRFADGEFIAANDSFLRFGGFTREEVIGSTSIALGIYSDLNQRATILERLRRQGHVHGYEQEFRSKTGEVRQNVLWIDVLTINGEECVLAISLDVTEQKRAAQQQKELEEQLRQAQKLEALGTLAGGIAHDFNNILGGIISYSELSKLDNPGNATLQENLDEVLRASERATALVRQILSFSRRQKEARQSLQLAPIVKEALSLLRATLPATITLRSELERALPNVLANPTQVHQIVMNLCTNAAHAMNGKQGQLSVELDELLVLESGAKPHVELRPGKYVRLTITDTGHGMDAATSKRVFEPFFTTKGSGEGTGLGLSVVHGIVKECEGVVTVDSEVGRGTSFTIYLPARSAAELQASVATTEFPRGNGERILFVDDEPVLGDVGQKMMLRLGYRALVFQSSLAALTAFQKEPTAYDALITDLTMPDMTGVDLARHVLATRPDLPVIVVSGSSGPLGATELRELGIRELLSKPLNYSTLARVLHQILQP